MKKFGWLTVCTLGFSVAVSLSAFGQDDKGGHKSGGPGGRPGGDPEARFKALDTDGNGTVSLAEFKAGHEKRMAAMKEHMGEKFDASKMPNPEEVFKKVDANGDGQATKDEMKEAHKNMPGPGGRREGGHGRGHKAPEGGAPKAEKADK